VITSSLLTLVVVPVVYCYLDDLGQWMRRLFGLPAPSLPAPSEPAGTIDPVCIALSNELL